MATLEELITKLKANQYVTGVSLPVPQKSFQLDNGNTHGRVKVDVLVETPGGLRQEQTCIASVIKSPGGSENAAWQRTITINEYSEIEVRAKEYFGSLQKPPVSYKLMSSDLRLGNAEVLLYFEEGAGLKEELILLYGDNKGGLTHKPILR